jgi:hypothetical protein
VTAPHDLNSLACLPLCAQNKAVNTGGPVDHEGSEVVERHPGGSALWRGQALGKDKGDPRQRLLSRAGKSPERAKQLLE